VEWVKFKLSRLEKPGVGVISGTPKEVLMITRLRGVLEMYPSRIDARIYVLK